ncbi:MAG: LuxR C-terminal-related transcriptional regulator [Gemmataceae bacterium]
MFDLDSDQARERWELLTARERQVAEKIALDHSNREIAEALGISPKTLDIHRANVKKKLDAKTAAGVARTFFAVRVAGR